MRKDEVGRTAAPLAALQIRVKTSMLGRLQHAGPGQGVLLGHRYTFTVGVVTDLGRPYRAECREFIAPHAPELFARSTRRGNTDSAGDDA